MRRCRRHGRRANPVDIIGDADSTRYGVALEGLLDDPAIDAVLVMKCRPPWRPPPTYAKRRSPASRNRREKWLRPKPILAIWIGSSTHRRTLRSAGIPNYPTETDAIRGFMHLVRHGEARALMETPPSLPGDFAPMSGARRLVEARSRRPYMAGPDRDHATARCLCDSDRAARLARTPEAAAEAARFRRRAKRRGQDSLPRHRAQVRGRRRSSQPDQRRRPCARPPPTSDRAPEKLCLTRALPASPSNR